MRKPYISTATYILNMSNYTKPTKKEIAKDNVEDWTETWRALFYHKLIKHQAIFSKTPYIFQIKSWNKMDNETQTGLEQMATNFIKKIKKINKN